MLLAMALLRALLFLARTPPANTLALNVIDDDLPIEPAFAPPPMSNEERFRTSLAVVPLVPEPVMTSEDRFRTSLAILPPPLVYIVTPKDLIYVTNLSTPSNGTPLFSASLDNDICSTEMVALEPTDSSTLVWASILAAVVSYFVYANAFVVGCVGIRFVYGACMSIINVDKVDIMEKYTNALANENTVEPYTVLGIHIDRWSSLFVDLQIVWEAALETSSLSENATSFRPVSGTKPSLLLPDKHANSAHSKPDIYCPLKPGLQILKTPRKTFSSPYLETLMHSWTAAPTLFPEQFSNHTKTPSPNGIISSHVIGLGVPLNLDPPSLQSSLVLRRSFASNAVKVSTTSRTWISGCIALSNKAIIGSVNISNGDHFARFDFSVDLSNDLAIRDILRGIRKSLASLLKFYDKRSSSTIRIRFESFASFTHYTSLLPSPTTGSSSPTIFGSRTHGFHPFTPHHSHSRLTVDAAVPNGLLEGPSFRPPVAVSVVAVPKRLTFERVEHIFSPIIPFCPRTFTFPADTSTFDETYILDLAALARSSASAITAARKNHSNSKSDRSRRILRHSSPIIIPGFVPNGAIRKAIKIRLDDIDQSHFAPSRPYGLYRDDSSTLAVGTLADEAAPASPVSIFTFGSTSASTFSSRTDKARRLLRNPLKVIKKQLKSNELLLLARSKPEPGSDSTPSTSSPSPVAAKARRLFRKPIELLGKHLKGNEPRASKRASTSSPPSAPTPQTP